MLIRKFLPEFVYGGTDGTVTTFAVMTGALGASLSPSVVLILGLANLFADGFSMAASNYLSTKSKKGITESTEYVPAPIETATATFISFIVVGFIPIAPFVLAVFIPQLVVYEFIISIVLTAFAFISIGAVKGIVVGEGKILSATETLLIGGLAAVISYGVGYLLRGFGV